MHKGIPSQLVSNHIKPIYNLDSDTANTYNNNCAGVAELADAADLKSAGVILVGSSPTPGTSLI